MRTILYLIIIALVQLSCTQNKMETCGNQFDFIKSNNVLPIIDLSLNQDPLLIRKKLNTVCGVNLCDSCKYIHFNYPFIIDNKPAFIEVKVEYDSPFCENCPVPMRMRNDFLLMINQQEQLLFEVSPLHADSLASKLFSYLETVGPSEFSPPNYNRTNYNILFHRLTHINFINSIINTILQTHTEFVQQKLKDKNIDFCKLSKSELVKLKNEYPINIEFDLEKMVTSEIPKDPPFPMKIRLSK